MQGSNPWGRSHRGVALRPLGAAPVLIWVLIAGVVLLMSVPRLRAQDGLATARSLYASAAYDDALKTLQQLSSSDAPMTGTSIREVEEYRFLCLLALGRHSEARESISAVVTADPLYKLDENETSPRVLNAFRAVRREVLPDILRSIYNAGKAMFDQKEYKGAETQFHKVIGLQGDPDLGGQGADLGTLAKGFLDLAASAQRAADAPALVAANAGPGAPPAAGVAGGNGSNGGGALPAAASSAGATSTASPVSVPASPAPNAAARGAIVATQPKAGEIVPPRILKRTIPNVPADLSRFGQLRAGEMEMLIDEQGRVQTARFLKPIHPVYDSLVLASTRQWLYEPARADGVPVKFRVTLKVTIQDQGRD